MCRVKEKGKRIATGPSLSQQGVFSRNATQAWLANVTFFDLTLVNIRRCLVATRHVPDIVLESRRVVSGALRGGSSGGQGRPPGRPEMLEELYHYPVLA